MFEFARSGGQGRDDGSVDLEWRGSPPRPLLRLSLGIGGTVALAFSTYLTIRAFQESEWVFLLLAGSLIFGLWFLSTSVRYWSEISWDPAKGVLRLTRSAMHFLVGARRTFIPYDGIVGAKFEAEVRDGRVTEVRWRFQVLGENNLLNIDLPVQGLDRREEALDLFHRCARAMGYRWFETQRSDPRGLVLRPLRRLRPGRAQAIPEISSGPDYERFTAQCAVAADRAVYQEPEEPLPPFQPSAARARDGILIWRPGERVRIRQLPGGTRDLPVVVLGSLFISAHLCYGLGYLAYFLIFGAEDTTHFKTWLLLSGVATAVLTIVFSVIIGIPEGGEGDLDWRKKEMFFRQGSRQRRLPITAAERVVLSGSWTKSKHRPALYWCTLYLALPGPDEVLFLTPRDARGPDAPFRAALPAAVELARALGVPWEWEDYPEGIFTGERPEQDRSPARSEDGGAPAPADRGGDLRSTIWTMALTGGLLGGLIIAAAGWDYGGPYALGLVFVVFVTGLNLTSARRRP